jgi:DNA-directed RNA polymerase subunit M/transcription elongation factor TFIIS
MSTALAPLPPALAALHPTPSQRTRAITLLTRALNGDVHNARGVEQHIFLTTLLQQVDYSAKVMQLAWNLKINGSWLLALYPPETLVLLDDAVLAETTSVAEWHAQQEMRLKRQQQLLTEEAKFEEAETSSHGGLVCNRCHSRSIAVQQQQTRSADEGMTVYCTCKQCGLRWKM